MIELLHSKLYYIYFLTLYFLFNKLSLLRIFHKDNTLLSRHGYLKVILPESIKKDLEDIKESLSIRATRNAVLYQNMGYDMSSVGSIFLSDKLLFEREQKDEMRKISYEILRNNPDILEYLKVPINKLVIDVTVLANHQSGTPSTKKIGSKNYHRDVHHSFFRSIKIFIPVLYENDEKHGCFKLIPLTKIPSNIRPEFSSRNKNALTYRDANKRLILDNDKHSVILQADCPLAVDTFNVFHEGGNITVPFTRLIIQILVMPPYNPDRYSDLTRHHFQRFIYFKLCSFLNFCRYKRV